MPKKGQRKLDNLDPNTIIEKRAQRKTLREIGAEIGCSHQTLSAFCKRHGIPLTAHHRSSIDLMGRTFGKLKVVRRTDKQIRSGSIVWECQCCCGRLIERPSGILLHRRNKIQSCGCFISEQNFRGFGDVSSSYLASVRKGAEHRKLLFDIDAEYIWTLYLSQNRRCALSGVEITVYRDYRTRSRRGLDNQTASLDRIDSTKGYVKGNVQWVHKDVNMMKQDHSDQDFVAWCKKIASWDDTKGLIFNPALPEPRTIRDNS